MGIGCLKFGLHMILCRIARATGRGWKMTLRGRNRWGSRIIRIMSRARTIRQRAGEEVRVQDEIREFRLQEEGADE